MRINIAFDIDGCVMDVMPRMEAQLAMCGIEVLNHGNYWMKTNPKLADEEWVKLWGIVFEDYKHTPPYQGAMDFLLALHARAQQPIHFITSRNVKHATVTHKAIKHYLKCPFTISFANRPFGKLDYLNGVRWMVEDNPHEVHDLLRAGKFVIMPRRKWNTDFDYDINYELSGLWDFMDQLIDYGRR